MKAITLTSHATAMDLVVEFPGNGVVPRHCLGPIPQFFVGASSKQGAQTFFAHRQAVQHLQHLEQDRNGYGVQNNRLQRAHHFDQHN